MPRDSRALLWDVREAAAAIDLFVAGMAADSYAASELVHSAVERKFEIIGEALNQLSRTDPALAACVPHVAQIVAFRNLLIHGYAAVKHERVWSVVHDYVPALRQAVEKALASS